ncbi:MAG: DNA repair protein RecN [Thermodesulfovibrio sp.]|nr:DNA repair protein RecN [Thermodesulfovibrio sp.]
MLKELRIKNLAIIDDLSISFGKGLNILTGETGAGKSIIIDALGLALGDRSQADLIRAGAKEASVQVYFDLQPLTLLPDLDIDAAEGLLLRRVLTAGGKSRAYLNDTMVTLQTLSELGKSLVDIMSQHEHQSLLIAENQRRLLDSYGRLQPEKEKTSALFIAARRLRQECGELREKTRERALRLDLLRFQVAEINTADPQPGEKESLEGERSVLANLTKLTALTDEAYGLLYESEGSCLEKLSRVRTRMKEMTALDSRLSDTAKNLEAALPLIEDISIALRGFRDRYDLDPARLESVEERLETLKKLEKKYGDGIRELLQYRDRAEEEMQSLESTDDRLAILESQLLEKEAELGKTAALLSAKRTKAARQIEKLIEETLKDLAFSSPGFRIEVRQETGDDGKVRVGPHGSDLVEFLFTANPGEPLKPLTKIISGGELSRVMLALKSILADLDSIPVLIFDEVDAGIGGKTAERVAQKLKRLADSHQVICITHLPQIASSGNQHLKIEKNTVDNRTTVRVQELNGSERTNEIARMLSGSITDISLKHAGELLGKDL